ncbi:MAG TPA: iron-containing redox enzyme family protein, partial [Polyangiaceae bacterium]
ELARFFATKSEEEAGHERWALADLREIECRFGVAVARRPAANIARLIAKLERHIDENPVSYLGYMIFTEYFTVLLGPAWMRALTQHCGVPSSALSVVEHHVELDREHAARGFRVLSDLSDHPGDELAVFEVVRGTMALLEAFYDELAALMQAPSHAA